MSLKFGVIGTNWITERFIQAAREAEGFTLSAVYSRTEEKAKEFAEKNGAAYTFTDLEEMAQSDVIDAVYIASPNSLHAEYAITLMNHGKHVICEKPIASNVKELESMIAAAKENNVLLMEAMRSTVMPNFKSIQEHIHKIGPVRRYFASSCQYSSRYDKYKEGTVLNAFNPKFSNGSLMDIGIYCLYPMVVLFGKPDSVKANGLLLESGVDGEGSILLNYEDKDAVVMYSKISNSYVPSEIQGENGSILIDHIQDMSKIEIRYKDGSTEDITVEQDKPKMYYEAKEFMDLVKNGELESKVNSHANSLAVMEIMDEARKQIGLVFPADEK
ncbi:Gfo/Idh/MocA family protein [Fictibacillus phosphorivorans]|uniref:Gfo/Idh/MocA family protein n=1 Tax=Fictibacillus phosphorivorans TaxID=1221500 RepID=UPI00203CA83B|nr:Gfo/Idh/MocA family oxidoreductase [Fictibacillus phosphorivorans]MCM3718134.1 Gfo/Idh/MocA family oxidoreductase [Fictibacillus phosphorivorans]MCM3775761.1 Gfo/Idh/MocA family oxidoreductase [Fictibacillus phosphorivorans]